MDDETRIRWTQSLQRHHLTGLVLTLLDGMGPLKVFVSQVLLSTSPFFSGTRRQGWQAFAEMLEDEDESRKFIETLREEKT